MPMPSSWAAMDPNQQPDFAAYLKAQRPDLYPPAAGGVPGPVMAAGQQLDQAKAENQIAAATNAAAKQFPDGQDVPRGTPTQQLLDQIGGQQLDGLKQQGLTVDALKKSLGDLEGKDLPLNLQSIAGLVDSWTGSHNAQYAAPSETAASRAEAVQKLRDTIAKTQQGMSQDEINLLKDRLTASYHSDESIQRGKDRQLQRDAINAQRDIAAGDKASKQDQNLLTHYQDQFNKDPVVLDASKKLAQNSETAQMLELARSNPAVRKTIAIDMAKAIVPSRLNETELKAFDGSGKATDRVNQAFQDMESGTLTDENYSYLKQMIDVMQQHDKRTLLDRTEHHARQYSANSGKDFTKAANDLTGGTYTPAEPSTPKVGDIVDGYVFKGGDASKQANWSKK